VLLDFGSLTWMIVSDQQIIRPLSVTAIFPNWKPYYNDNIKFKKEQLDYNDGRLPTNDGVMHLQR